MVGKNNLARASGLVQAITTIAILAGIFVFSIAFEQVLIDQPFNDTGSLLKRIAPIGWGLGPVQPDRTGPGLHIDRPASA